MINLSPSLQVQVSKEYFGMSKDKKNWQKFKDEHQHHEQSVDEDSVDQVELDVEAVSEEPDEQSAEQLNYEELLTKLNLVEQQAHDNWDKSVRAQAELDNVRRRAEREVANAHRYGVEKLLNALLPTIDSLEQALQLASENEAFSAMREGLELTMKLFVDALQKFDLQQLDPVGQTFNPQEHEAMSIVDVPGHEPNSVVNVVQKGYKLNDRVIRPARVVVSKK